MGGSIPNTLSDEQSANLVAIQQDNCTMRQTCSQTKVHWDNRKVRQTQYIFFRLIRWALQLGKLDTDNWFFIILRSYHMWWDVRSNLKGIFLKSEDLSSFFPSAQLGQRPLLCRRHAIKSLIIFSSYPFSILDEFNEIEVL